jgi:phosphate transport system permease protein
MTERDTMSQRQGDPPESTGQRPHDSGTDSDRELLGPAGMYPPAEHGPVIVGSNEPRGILDTEPSELASPPSAAAGGKVRIGDRIFFGLSAGAGAIVVVLIALIAMFLVSRAIPALTRDKVNFFTSTTFDAGNLTFGVLQLLRTTVMSSALALIFATPVAIGIALFLTQYAPKRVRKPIAYVIDLLAAIPSIIYGIWGIYILAPHLTGIQRFFYHLGWFPFFKNAGVATGSIFDASVVLAVMILPIITAISRDVFDRTPRANIEAAWALGATRWEVIRLAVLPYGRPGVVSGAMLGLGRALGETIAVLLILTTPQPGATWSIFNGGTTFASLIGSGMKEAEGPDQTGAYIAAGLVLFVLTFAVNAAARAIVNRRKEFV